MIGDATLVFVLQARDIVGVENSGAAHALSARTMTDIANE